MRKLAMITVIAVTLLFAEKSFSQTADKQIPKWVSLKGYWVVEGNIHTPKENTIWFYTNNNELVYKENISGSKMKLQKRKVKLQLKEVLERSINDWAANNTYSENKDYVKAILH